MLKTAVIGKTANGATQLSRIMVMSGDRIVLVDATTGQPPKKVITKMVNKDLHIFAEGATEPSVILNDYASYDQTVQISGIDSSGAYVNYGSAQAGSMELGAVTPITSTPEPIMSTSAWWGVGILAVAGGVAVAAGGGGGDDSTITTTTTTPTTPTTLDTTAPSAPVIAVVGTNNIVNLAENASLVISGTGEIGTIVKLAVTNQTAVVDSSGNWNITVADVANSFGQGLETLSVTQTDVAGYISIAGTRDINIDTIAPTPIITDDEPNVTADIAGGDILYTFTFSEAVVGFNIGDILIDPSQGTAKTFTKVSDAVYTLGVTPLSGYEGNMTINTNHVGYTDLAGNIGSTDVASTQVVDMLAPAFVSAETSSATESITLTYDSLLELVDMSNVGNFSVEVNGIQYTAGGTPPPSGTPSAPGILNIGMPDGQHVTITLAGIDILSTDSVRVAYSDVTTDVTPAIQDLAGNDAASFGWYMTAVI